ncbi:MAG: dTDP-glucose 4,6-dehydratase [Deltaproteobacteria bacterium]|nr:dTDP-glucose 4,6-dehydratase [Deltaproteobacteria bacterium]
MNVLVTGGCGFIGSNFIRFLLSRRKHVRVINVDKLTYAGNPANLKDVAENHPDRYLFIKADISDKRAIGDIFDGHVIDWVVNFAAESHVDRSILGPEVFIQVNIFGTFNLLEGSRRAWGREKDNNSARKLFLQISTDEVYGTLGESGLFSEQSPYDPSSPYSASKAASDHLVNAYFRTYGLPAIITNCSNNYGPYQFPEKLIPLMINNATKGLDLPVYGDGENVRDWIYVEDHCEALLRVLERGTPGEKYNIGGNCEKKNKDVVETICDQLDRKLGLLEGRPRRTLMRYVADRPGHDRRYAIDCSKIMSQLGWSPRVSFEQGISMTIEWYLDNKEWVQSIMDGSYMEYYKTQYGERLDGRG